MSQTSLERDLKKLKAIYDRVRHWVGEPVNTEPVVVYISGCWDLFHVGHLNIIEAAAALGDYLVLGVVTDEGMRSYGKHPLIPYEHRRAIVAALECVDAVVEYHNLGDISSVMRYGTHIRVVGPECGTFKAQLEARAILEDLGVKYVVLPRTPGVSTTLIRQACYKQEMEVSDAEKGELEGKAEECVEKELVGARHHRDGCDHRCD